MNRGGFSVVGRETSICRTRKANMTKIRGVKMNRVEAKEHISELMAKCVRGGFIHKGGRKEYVEWGVIERRLWAIVDCIMAIDILNESQTDHKHVRKTEAKMAERGVYGKYVLSKADGSEVDPQACYFVLRLDTDPAARAAARVYAEQCGNSALAGGLHACINAIERGPCTCRSIDECDHMRWDDPIWRHGG